jgi:hypothetical protein
MRSVELVGFVTVLDTLILAAASFLQGDLRNLESVSNPQQLATIIITSAAIKLVSALMYQRAVQVSCTNVLIRI